MPENEVNTQTSETPAAPQAPAPLPTVSPKGVVGGREILKRMDLITEGAWALVLTNPKGDILEKMAADGIELNTAKMTPYLIRDWNFIDQNGNKLAITPENFNICISFQDNALMLHELGLDSLLGTKKKIS